MHAASRVVVTVVRMQFAGLAAWPATLARNRWQGVDLFVEHRRVVTTGRIDAEHHWGAFARRDEVALAAHFPSVRWVGVFVRPREGSPRWPVHGESDGTNAESSGSIFLCSAALISLFLFRPVHRQRTSPDWP